MLLRQSVSQHSGYQPSLQFKWQLIILLPCLVPAIGFLLLGQGYWHDVPTFLYTTLIGAGFALVCQFMMDWVSQRVVIYLPDIEQAVKRIALLFLLFFLISCVTLLVQLAIFSHWQLFGFEEKPGQVKHLAIAAGLISLVTVGIFESLHSHKKWRENTLEKEQLKKTNLQSQYESLKNQINPHFLFNTLNSLSSLIVEDPHRAEGFINEMANVYRYLLQSNEQAGGGRDLTSLANEIVFVQSYFHLLKTRYGQGISLLIAVPDAVQDYLLPPLTLQMLVENAIKHNVIHTQKPLMIKICLAEDGRLEIQNNLQPRNSRVLSNGVGLSNISEKYRLLAQQMRIADDMRVVVSKEGGQFVVSLPLL
ncbi:sensor histidine kinase [Dyadobacter luticola]|uniref:Signal transduction histidine kinase internal region domain-containing protein n=1 Tax=Dyadobacter luticola TaxID=1979387 RepID=A0A5R9KZ80_9BACT|nr:histidine kinase [Dyadobacter luticola]TLV01491.1 hypothetical protein FEN17_18870 [Dyadobacter luticola]